MTTLFSGGFLKDLIEFVRSRGRSSQAMIMKQTTTTLASVGPDHTWDNIENIIRDNAWLYDYTEAGKKLMRQFIVCVQDGRQPDPLLIKYFADVFDEILKTDASTSARQLLYIERQQNEKKRNDERPDKLLRDYQFAYEVRQKIGHANANYKEITAAAEEVTEEWNDAHPDDPLKNNSKKVRRAYEKHYLQK